MKRKLHSPIRQHPNIHNLLSRMNTDIADSFDDNQLFELNKALAGRRWGKHRVDCRFTLNFWRKKYYLVILAGRDVRALSRTESELARLSMALFTTLFLTGCALLGLLVLYLVKSALGIDLFENFSLGIWGWFRTNFG
ncbi:3-phosphoshikimate 1-carboxyvinyltransferase [Alteromonas aestuariivivens]|uniref:3-phosphoshikimate 1-carboxyvinyltransferase n=1 Tax=Alteromonas aestuariivivens TaxID=1938339 RepID=A0A3D8MCP5_9ALTE|nr:3-phosphoshikimate 1-carboxyvinyltransferase [Alteromonas aestuariivivens]RDV28161.1 3-phosphoshikimate 1-carboxyvinyltransferase [Alteromonas aestuariivivens]